MSWRAGLPAGDRLRIRGARASRETEAPSPPPRRRLPRELGSGERRELASVPQPSRPSARGGALGEASGSGSASRSDTPHRFPAVYAFLHELGRPPGDGCPTEAFLDGLPACSAQPHAQIAIFNQSTHCVCHGLGRARRHKQSRVISGDDLGDTANGRADYGPATRHRFKTGDAGRLSERGQNDDVGCSVDFGHARLRDRPQENAPILKPSHSENLPHRNFLPPRAGDHCPPVSRAQRGQRTREPDDTILLDEAARQQEDDISVRRCPLIPQSGEPRSEALRIDAVRNDGNWTAIAGGPSRFSKFATYGNHAAGRRHDPSSAR